MGSNGSAKKGLLENALSLRTSAHAGVAIPRIFKHLGRKTKLFPSNRGAATPVTSVTGSQRHTFLTAAAAVEEGRYGREWYVFSNRSRPLRPSSVSLTRASTTFYGIAATGSYVRFNSLRDAPPAGEAFSTRRGRSRITDPPNTAPAGPDTGRRALPGGCRFAPGWPGCSAGPPGGCSGSRSARWTGAAACSRWNT